MGQAKNYGWVTGGFMRPKQIFKLPNPSSTTCSFEPGIWIWDLRAMHESQMLVVSQECTNSWHACKVKFLKSLFVRVNQQPFWKPGFDMFSTMQKDKDDAPNWQFLPLCFIRGHRLTGLSGIVQVTTSIMTFLPPRVEEGFAPHPSILQTVAVSTSTSSIITKAWTSAYASWGFWRRKFSVSSG